MQKGLQRLRGGLPSAGLAAALRHPAHMCWPILQGIRRSCKIGPPGIGPSRFLSLPADMPEKDSRTGSPLMREAGAPLRRRC